MPLPLILAGAAIAAAGYGAKKGYDGYQDKSHADEILDDAKRIYQKAKDRFDAHESLVNRDLTELGELQIKIGQDFESFQKIANELYKKISDSAGKDLKLNIPKHKLNQIKAFTLSTVGYASKIAAAGAGGAAAAYAVYGGVMALAAASTGTPIAALSGAAAYNATMAAIGGGALSAGGLGMAGGAAILGGVVAAPILAVAGYAYASHAEEALRDARRVRNKSEEAASKLEKAQEQLIQLRKCVARVLIVTKDIYSVFTEYHDYLKKTSIFLELKGNADELQEEIIQKVENGYMVASILVNLIGTPLFKIKKDKNGNPVESEDGVPEFSTDENGQRLVNTTEIEDAIDSAGRSVEEYR